MSSIRGNAHISRSSFLTNRGEKSLFANLILYIWSLWSQTARGVRVLLGLGTRASWRQRMGWRGFAMNWPAARDVPRRWICFGAIKRWYVPKIHLVCDQIIFSFVANETWNIFLSIWWEAWTPLVPSRWIWRGKWCTKACGWWNLKGENDVASRERSTKSLDLLRAAIKRWYVSNYFLFYSRLKKSIGRTSCGLCLVCLVV
jgi:hypothetical protein